MFFIVRNKGFSLVEVVITVAIIAILGAIAIPLYNKYRVEARRSEAFHFLPAIHGTQLEHMVEEGRYTCVVDDLMIDNPTNTHYKYFLCSLDGAFLGDGLRIGPDCAGGDCVRWGEVVTDAQLNTGYAAIATGNIDDDATYDSVGIGNRGVLCPPDTCGQMTADHTSLPIAGSPDLSDDVNQ